MSPEEVQALVEKYSITDGFSPDDFGQENQYDYRSANINYAMVRHFKPKVIVEFGTRRGRCTHDILKALQKNGVPFLFKPYEIDDGFRAIATENIGGIFGYIVTIGGDITKATDLPDNIDYLFIDNNHDRETTEWVFNILLKKCVPGAIVHFHDMSFHGDWKHKDAILDETKYVLELHEKGILPLKKLYWTYEEGDRQESTWWQYEPS